MANDGRGFLDTHTNQKEYNEKYVDNDPGPYVGVVKVTVDPLKIGRLGVNIPALSNTTEPSATSIIWCHYLSPFYGSKPLRAVSSTEPGNYQKGQTSYGLWAVPPDVDTEVLVIFAKGENNENNAYWIGCIPQPKINKQVPGLGSTKRTLNARERARGGQTNYGTEFLPSGDINRNFKAGQTLENSNKADLPINDLLADQLLKQGLVQDDVRGTTSSSASRETPSQVFGINTPGPITENSKPKNIGLEGRPIRADRDLGHSFVMDDGAVDSTNQLTRLRTASGHQLLMHDTDGVVYLANGSGKAFIEMSRDGTISVYSANGIDFRSGTDFNLHSDTNINFHAKGNINFTAEQNVQLNAEANVHTMAKNSIRNSSQGTLRSYAGTVLSSFSAGTQLHGSGGNFDLAGAQVHLNSQSARQGWGPSWLVPEHDQVRIKVTGGPGGLIDIDDRNPIVDGIANKIANRTTVTDFVTHEPYDRQSSTARTKKYINEVIEEIKKSSPEISATELKLIKSELLKQPSIKAVADKLGKVVRLNDKIKLPIKDLNSLVSKANDLQKLFDNPKGAAINFVKGFIGSTSGQALVNNVFRRVRTFFSGQSSNPGDRDTFDPTTGR